MDRKDRFSGIFLLVLSGYVLFESRRLGLGYLYKPGPGLFPFLAGGAIGVLALILLYQTGWAKKGGKEPEAIISWRGTLLSFLFLIVYISLLETLGFIPTTFLFIAALLRIVERKGWGPSILTAVLASLVAFGLFGIILEGDLPPGLLGFLAG